jgi:hypothetical protein
MRMLAPSGNPQADNLFYHGLPSEERRPSPNYADEDGAALTRSFSMSRTEDSEKGQRTAALQHWETELRTLAQHLEDEDHQNGWVVRYRYLGEPRQLTAVVTIDGVGFARFTRDELGIIGVFESGDPQRFSDRYDAFDAAVKRRITRR